MKLHRHLKILLNAIYLHSILYLGYVLVCVVLKGGLYTGYPNGERYQLLSYYATHKAMGILHIVFMAFLTFVAGLFCFFGMGKDLQAQSVSVNLVNLSVVLCAVFFGGSVHEWISG